MRTHRLTSLAGAAALGLALLAGGMAVTADAQPASSAPTYAADVVHSSVIFKIRHAGVTNFYGRFNDFEGTFTLDEDNPAASRFNFTVKLESVDTGASGRDDHLRSPDFFNVKQFPAATFKSTDVRRAEEGVYEVTGELDLHGVTKPVTATVVHTGEGSFRNNPISAIEATLQIKRSDFGMTTYLAPDGGEGGGIGNTVTLTIAVEGVQQ